MVHKDECNTIIQRFVRLHPDFETTIVESDYVDAIEYMMLYRRFGIEVGMKGVIVLDMYTPKDVHSSLLATKKHMLLRWEMSVLYQSLSGNLRIYLDEDTLYIDKSTFVHQTFVKWLVKLLFQYEIVTYRTDFEEDTMEVVIVNKLAWKELLRIAK